MYLDKQLLDITIYSYLILIFKTEINIKIRKNKTKNFQ